MGDDCKKKNAEILEKIIFHLSEAYKLFNDLKDRRVSAVEQLECGNAIKLCKDAIKFINGKVDSMENILRGPWALKDLKVLSSSEEKDERFRHPF